MEDVLVDGGRGLLVWRVLVSGLAVLVCTFALYVYRSGEAQKRKRLPPGPRGLPILGSMLALTGNLPHQTFMKLAAKYGPIVFMHVGSVPTLVISSPALAKEVLKTNDQAWASRPNMTVLKCLTYGAKDIAVAPHGPSWRKARKIGTLQLLSPSRIAGFQGQRQLEYQLALKSVMEASQEGLSVSLKSMLSSMYTNIVTQMMWRKRHFVPRSSASPEEIAFQQIIRDIFDLAAIMHIRDYFTIPLLKPLMSMDLQGCDKRTRAVHKRFDEFVDAVIDERRAQKLKESESESEDKFKSDEVEDFVDVLLNLCKEAENTDKEDIPLDMVKGLLFDMVMAGTETSSTTVEWIFCELIRHPRVMSKLQNELDTVVGTNRLVNEADVPKLEYLQAVVKEGLRLHPANPFLFPHESMLDSEVSGYFVPAGTTVHVNAYAIQRDPSVWERPLEFDPDRFLFSDIDLKGQNFELLPFGSGRRMCPGLNLGLIAVQSTVASLMHAFNWSLSNGEKPEDLDMSESMMLTSSKRTPLVLATTPRLAAHVICTSA